jgi:mannose-6-phosphate isomerase-like protein (cupin superfamily)
MAPSTQPLKRTPSESVSLISDSPEALEVEATYGAHGSPPPKHYHPAQDEHFDVRSGRIDVRVGDSERKLGPGETLEIPRGTPHQMWNSGAEEARLLWRTSPAGRTREWFEALDRVHRTGRVGKNGMPGPLAFAALLTEYRDVIRLAAGPEPVVRGLLAALAPLGRRRGYLPN